MDKYYIISSYYDESHIADCRDKESAEKEITTRKENGYIIEAVIRGKRLDFEGYQKVTAYKIKD